MPQEMVPGDPAVSWSVAPDTKSLDTPRIASSCPVLPHLPSLLLLGDCTFNKVVALRLLTDALLSGEPRLQQNLQFLIVSKIGSF